MPFGRAASVRSGGQFILVTVGVVRSPSITLVAEDEDSNKVALDVGALQNTIGAIAEINIDQGKEGELTYKGKVPLAFGVELLKLDYDETENKFNLSALRRAQQIRGDSEILRDFIGDPQTGNVFIAVSEEKR
jgi:hypothetical protein